MGLATEKYRAVLPCLSHVEKIYLCPMQQTQKQWVAYAALAAICIIWGTTYTAIKFAIRDFPPYFLVGIRQGSAGLILLLLAAQNRQLSTVPNWGYVWRQALTGVFSITGGNGFITWGMQYVSSGLASIIGALTPMLVVLINLFWRGGETMTRRQLVGVGLGFAGIGFIFSDGWRDFLNPDYRWGIFGCFASCFTWSMGMVMSKRFNSPAVSPMANAGLQITAGGLGGFVLSGFLDHSHTIQHTALGWGSVVYLVLIGSALAFTLYMIVLKHLHSTVASIYTYINPAVAVLLGWMFLGEHLTAAEGIGMVITLTGVWIVGSK